MEWTRDGQRRWLAKSSETFHDGTPMLWVIRQRSDGYWSWSDSDDRLHRQDGPVAFETWNECKTYVESLEQTLLFRANPLASMTWEVRA